jgi:hypothetical protein
VRANSPEDATRTDCSFSPQQWLVDNLTKISIGKSTGKIVEIKSVALWIFIL